MIGCSLGGWIAAELATKAPERVRRLVLVGPGGREDRPDRRLDIPDIFALPQATLETLLFHDPDRMRVDPSRLTDEQLAIQMRNRETTRAADLGTVYAQSKTPPPAASHHRAGACSCAARSDGLVSAAYMDWLRDACCRTRAR